ncbi:sterol desaturase family protein [Parvibaculum lavamentivorans]|nr:sterol desaturase family protein [Parvibaculum lavamentivorans]
MFEFLTLNEPALRFGAFAGVLAAMAIWEALSPRRALASGRARRWTTNLALTGTGTLLLRVAVPLLAVGVAAEAERRGVGLFHWMEVPYAAAFILSLLALDVLVYAQHVVFHRVGLLWRLHRVHHADTDVDVTTGIRFHPGETLISMAIKMAAVALLGAPVAAVILFEVVLNATAMFNHSNIALGTKTDTLLRRLIVTPDMHRVHHSVHRDEHDTNYGFSLSLWDMVFGTYRPQPRDGHTQMRLGLTAFPAPLPSGFGWSLWNPFSTDRHSDGSLPDGRGERTT